MRSGAADAFTAEGSARRRHAGRRRGNAVGQHRPPPGYPGTCPGSTGAPVRRAGRPCRGCWKAWRQRRRGGAPSVGEADGRCGGGATQRHGDLRRGSVEPFVKCFPPLGGEGVAPTATVRPRPSGRPCRSLGLPYPTDEPECRRPRCRWQGRPHAGVTNACAWNMQRHSLTRRNPRAAADMPPHPLSGGVRRR